jgi:hypothetical protein
LDAPYFGNQIENPEAEKFYLNEGAFQVILSPFHTI